MERLRSTINGIKEDIEKAEKAKANREMIALVDEANRIVRDAKKLFNSEKFDDAMNKFKHAKELYLKAVSIAKSFNFREDWEKILGAIKEMDRSIEACMLEKAGKMIEAASKERGKAKEKRFSQTLEYLNSISFKISFGKKQYNELKKKAMIGIVRARIEIGEDMMRNGEEFFNKREYYNAKEAYRRARDYFEKLSDYIAENKISELKDEVDAHIYICVENIRRCTDVMIGRKSVREVKLMGVGEIERGVEVKREDIILTFPKDLLKYYTEPKYIGEGGYYWVYKARRREDGRLVAVKIPKYWDEKMGKNFVDEVSIWKTMDHPNIARIYDYNVVPRGYIEMELADYSLDRIEKPIPPMKAARLIFEIAKGLRYAHSKNVCHLDLKPGNILIKDDKPKITDWGMAKVLRRSRLTSGKAKGYTPLYAAPEQIKDEPVDEKTDIFQLGQIFYELVTGKPPFEAKSEEAVKHKILNEDPIPPSKLNPDAKFLEPIIMKCLEKNKENRYQSIRELLMDLAEVLGMEIKVTRDRVLRINSHSMIIEIYLETEDLEKCITQLKHMRDDVSSDVKAEIDEVIRMYDAYRSTKSIEIDSLKREIKEKLKEIINMARIKV
ncbi:serine/threonine-protein kinase [Staphylothermus hellenicus]|uniref:Serine/threonine protein kinase n=1 Tax=Staphylothermus hellenicus (strain DSM 12710 / JCM 10830 / BK20S6-10-b1 / P8) TaxID=591019 RepID=D7DBT1_STAHD|nr:serine/threonine-protein kinase [Staphylothermus hellenicus]ADI31628.1 serine/threonine protein kinase [Staphylothermus hellenicus DSM 12710]